jgi:ATPase family associated with various cellular activities (AAA)
MSKGNIAIADVTALVKARNPIIWIVTREESRVEVLLSEALGKIGYTTYMWDVGQGVTEPEGKTNSAGSADPATMIQFITDRASGKNKETRVEQRAAWIMRDLPVWLTPPLGITTQRKLRNVARLLPTVEAARHQVIIILTPQTEVPSELLGCTQVMDWPLPDASEIGSIYDAQVEQIKENPSSSPALLETLTPANRQESIDAALGLSSDETTNCFAHALIVTKRFDPLIISREKKRIITRERVLDWFDPLPGGLGEVGGLENLKAWLTERSSAYTPEARAYGLPTPRGIIIAGMSGCGKSLTAKAAATLLRCPLLRLDLGALKSKYVGESEANLRKAFQVIDTIGKCVILLDEVEKALSGAESASDGGVSLDALGAILTWMQERRNEAFLIATCNDPRRLPPEFLRKERFDEVFFVDLPTLEERVAILLTTLRKLKRDVTGLDLRAIAACCDEFTGAEVANIVPSAMFKAFSDGARPITGDDLIAEAGRVVRLMDSMKPKMESLREWGTRAVPATIKTIDPGNYMGGARRLDVA